MRAIAALLVVAAHVGGFEADTFGGHWFSMFHVIGSTGVDVFFVISGFIMATTTSNVRHGIEGARKFLWRRATRIYPPYMVVTAAVLALYLWKPAMVNSDQSQAPDVLASFLLLPQAGLPLLMVGWTLVYEMYFYLVFTIGLLAPKRAFPWVLTGWAALTGMLALVPVEGGYLRFMGNPLHFEFVFGVVIGALVLRERIWKPTLVASVGLALSVLIWSLMLAGAIPGVESNAFRTFSIGLSLAALMFGLVGMEHDGRVIFPRWLASLGDSSYSLYLTHILTIAVVGVVFDAAIPNNLLTHIAGLAVAVLASVAGGKIFYAAVERPLLRLFHKPRRGRAVTR